MNLRHLAFKNIKGNWRSYKAFLYSSCFSIIIFFMYASFIYHPDVANGVINPRVQKGLGACNCLIVVFSALFILYSNTTFLRSRKKELGLLTLIGTTRRQIARMVILEQMMIGLLSIVIGVGIGMVFSKLFFMMMSTLLEVKNPIPFVWNGKAILLTSVTYFLLFFVLSSLGVGAIRRLEVVELLKDARKERTEPFYSRWLLVLGIVCITVGYVLSIRVTLVNFGKFFYPVIGLVTIGTYFLFTQGSVACLKALQRKKSLFYQYPNLFVISNLVYKMKDNARFLFTISILTALVVSATGAMLTYYADLKHKVTEGRPYAFSYTEKGIGLHTVLQPERLQETLQKYGFSDAREMSIEQLPAKFSSIKGKEMDIMIVSEALYNTEAKRLGKREWHSQPGSGVLLYPDAYGEFRFYEGSQFVFTLMGAKHEMKLNIQEADSIFASELCFLVNDEDYKKFAASVPKGERYVYYAYEIKNWEKTEELARELQQQVTGTGGESRSFEGRTGPVQIFDTRILPFLEVKQSGALTLFIGGFISVLFFLSSCSMTYFKWFTDIEQDRSQFHSLLRIGMTGKEINRVAIWQMGIVFFIPILTGVLHSVFALYSLSHMLDINLLQTSLVVIGIYCTAAFLYFLLAQREYMKHI